MFGGKDERGKRELEDWRIVFSRPFWLRRELKDAATTTVGRRKGTAVRARRRDLPGKLNRENKIADGRPISNVRRVERAAW
jgi:hypothetical protein